MLDKNIINTYDCGHEFCFKCNGFICDYCDDRAVNEGLAAYSNKNGKCPVCESCPRLMEVLNEQP